MMNGLFIENNLPPRQFADYQGSYKVEIITGGARSEQYALLRQMTLVETATMTPHKIRIGLKLNVAPTTVATYFVSAAMSCSCDCEWLWSGLSGLPV